MVYLFKELARYVINKQSQCSSVFADAKVWIGFYQRSVDFDVTNNLTGNIDVHGTNSTVGNRPLHASTQAVAVASRQQRRSYY